MELFDIKGDHNNLYDLIPNFDKHLAVISDIGTSGALFAFNAKLMSSEYIFTSYPREWIKTYNDNNYVLGDPVISWSFTTTGRTRWSEISKKITAFDIFNTMKKAQAYNLNYGAIFSKKINGKQTVLSVSRDDREITDTEMDILSNKWDVLSNYVVARNGVTNKEIEVLQLFSQGLKYDDISNELEISTAAVKRRLNTAREKLEAKSPTHAVKIAINRDFIE